MQRSPRNRRR